MDQHINWRDPERPPTMNFARIVCLVLGTAGLVVSALAAVGDRSIGEFFAFGLIFIVMFCLGLTARPRRWFSAADEIPDGEDPYERSNTPWWKRTVDQEYFFFGNKPFTLLSKLDYALLFIVLPANVLLVPVFIPMLPKLGEIPGWFTPACIIVCVSTGCVYFWQLKATDRLGWIAPLFMLSLGLFLYVWGYRLDDRDTMISGVIGVETSFWCGIRLVTISLFQSKSK